MRAQKRFRIVVFIVIYSTGKKKPIKHMPAPNENLVFPKISRVATTQLIYNNKANLDFNNKLRSKRNHLHGKTETLK